MSPIVDKFNIGDLVRQSPRKGLFRRGQIGIAIQIMEGRSLDEPHVKIQFPDGTQKILDVAKTRYVGRPTSYNGQVIVKWLEGQPEGANLHQEWSAEMVTESGWALARDPWGDMHWLPLRDDGGDFPYVFWRGYDRHVITMQTMC